MIRVLQQIAIGYVLAFLVLHRGSAVQALTAAGLLAGHSLAFVLYGRLKGVGPWAPGVNLGWFVDNWLHTHLMALANRISQAVAGTPATWTIWPPSPGGYVTLNAVSSTATILLGGLCGDLLRSGATVRRKLAILALLGGSCLLLGLVLAGGTVMPGVVLETDAGFLHGMYFSWAAVVPMVKHLWTSSFALFAAGWTSLMLLVFYAVLDGLQWRRWALPFVVVGMNSIAMYVMAGVLKEPVRKLLKPFVHGPLSSWPTAGPLVEALLVLLVLWLFCLGLYRRRVFFKL
jgi:predicted acyltransferase